MLIVSHEMGLRTRSRGPRGLHGPGADRGARRSGRDIRKSRIAAHRALFVHDSAHGGAGRGMTEFFTFALEALPQLLSGTVITLELTFGSILLGFCIGLPLSVLRVYGPPLAAKIPPGLHQSFPGHTAVGAVVRGLLRLAGHRPHPLAHGGRLRHPGPQLRRLSGGIFPRRHPGGEPWADGRGPRHRHEPHQGRAAHHPAPGLAPGRAGPGPTNSFPWSNTRPWCFLIAVPDLMGQAKIISSQKFAPIPCYILVALIYVVLVGRPVFCCGS